MEQLRGEPVDEHNVGVDWSWDGDETDEEAKIRAEARKILELPELPISATCVRVPVLVGHAESVWVETEDELTADQARELLAAARGPLDPAVLGALASSAPDVEHIVRLPRPGGRKLYPSHRVHGWHRAGGLPAPLQLVLAGLVVGLLLGRKP